MLVAHKLTIEDFYQKVLIHYFSDEDMAKEMSVLMEAQEYVTSNASYNPVNPAVNTLEMLLERTMKELFSCPHYFNVTIQVACKAHELLKDNRELLHIMKYNARVVDDHIVVAGRVTDDDINRLNVIGEHTHVIKFTQSLA